MGGDGAHEDGVAVGLGLGHGRRAEIAAGAAAIVHHHRLAELLAHALGDEAADQIGGAAGGEGDDEGDGARGIVLRAGGRGGEGELGAERG